jgi:hypothetical protein
MSLPHDKFILILQRCTNNQQATEIGGFKLDIFLKFGRSSGFVYYPMNTILLPGCSNS